MTDNMDTLVFATANRHKAAEIAAVLQNTCRVVTPADIGFSFDVEENGTSLEENALLKAKAAYSQTGIPAFSDDTGLYCDGLEGLPGIHAARFGALYGPPVDNNTLLLDRLKNITNRQAHFVSVFCLYNGEEAVFFRGELRGSIALEVAGEGGFGYDPLFVPEGFQKCIAEMPAAVKYLISHRTRALRAMLGWLEAKKMDV